MDRARTSTERAWRTTGRSVLSFAILFVAGTQIPGVRVRSPWSEDPYDVVVSIAGLVLPVVLFLTWVRVRLRRSSDEGSARVRRSILRGIAVILSLEWATIIAAAAAVALRARSDAWSSTTVVLVVVLAFSAGLALNASVSLRRVWLVPAGDFPVEDRTGPDALDDVAALLGSWGSTASAPFPRVGSRLTGLGHGLEVWASSPWGPRRHTFTWCLALSMAFGIGLSMWRAIAEGPAETWSQTLVAGGVVACTGAALVAGSYAVLGGYLELIRREPTERTASRGGSAR